MKIRSRTLCQLVRGYSIATVPGTEIEGCPAFVAGSEGDGALLLFRPPDFEPVAIADNPGGFISTWPLILNGRHYQVASTMFRPGFDAADSRLMLYDIGALPSPTPTLIGDLPYTHRVTMLHRNGRDFLLASTLCAAKANRDDWSQPGGIHLAEVPADPSGSWPMRQIVAGLNKNHGMDFARLGHERRPGYLLSAMEGLFFLPVPDDPSGTWVTETIDNDETSDAIAFDWDADNEPEIFSISPFHGHVLAVHKKSHGGWKKHVIHDDLAMGHIVWAGDFLGRPGLLAGSRREKRELRLYRPDGGGGIDPDYTVIDDGIGPTQIAVLPHGTDRATLYVAAHGIDEVRLYDIERTQPG